MSFPRAMGWRTSRRRRAEVGTFFGDQVSRLRSQESSYYDTSFVVAFVSYLPHPSNIPFGKRCCISSITRCLLSTAPWPHYQESPTLRAVA